MNYNYPTQFQYPEDTWCGVNLDGLLYDCNFWTDDDGKKYITLYQCLDETTTDLNNFITYELVRRGRIDSIMQYMKTKGDPDDYFALVNILRGEEE